MYVDEKGIEDNPNNSMKLSNIPFSHGSGGA
jgi:hypothetical protein